MDQPPLTRGKKQPMRRKHSVPTGSRNVFEVARTFNQVVEQANVLERHDDGSVRKRLVPDLTQHLTIYPNPKLGVIVVECSGKLAALDVLAPYVPNQEGKVRQLRYGGFELQLVVRKS